jgi:dihydrofolate reductase
VRAPEVDPSTFAVTSADPPDGAHTSRGGIRYRFLRYYRVADA